MLAARRVLPLVRLLAVLEAPPGRPLAFPAPPSLGSLQVGVAAGAAGACTPAVGAQAAAPTTGVPPVPMQGARPVLRSGPTAQAQVGHGHLRLPTGQARAGALRVGLPIASVHQRCVALPRVVVLRPPVAGVARVQAPEAGAVGRPAIPFPEAREDGKAPPRKVRAEA